MTNLGHEIALSEMRMSSRSFAIRVMSSLGASFCFLIFCIFVFGSQGVLMHVFRFCVAMGTFEIRSKIPIFAIRKIDIQNVAQSHEILMRDALFWKCSLLGCAIVFCGTFFWISYVFFKKGQRAQLERIMRGNRLVTPSAHNKIMKLEYGKTPALIISKNRVCIPEPLQYLHFGFIGASGCGKSTAIEEILSHVHKCNDKVFIVDLNGSFFSKFGREGDHILSLRDPRSRAWDFWCEDIEAENLAAAMIEADSGNNKYFWKGSRAVLSSLLRNNTNCNELWEDFKKSTPDICTKLSDKNEISQRIIGNGKGDQADGILGTTVLDFSFLKELNQWNQEEKKFSILDWVKNDQDRSWVYLVVADKDLEISKPLLRLWFDLACLGALSRDSSNSNNAHLWLMVDELKSIGQLPSLPAILDKGRKYKASAVLGLQAISQIEKIYGDRDAKSILQGIQNQFYFKMNEVESAKYASDALGEQEFEQANVGISFGQEKIPDRGSLNRSTTHKKIVLPDEIKSLRPLQCYAKLSHHQPFKIEFDISKRQIIHASIQSKTNKNHIIGLNFSQKADVTKEQNSQDKWLLAVPPEHVSSAEREQS